MRTILYNTNTNQIINPNKTYEGGYNNKFPLGTLKPNEIELEYIDTPVPQYDTRTQRISSYWEVEDNLRYVKKYNFIDKTPEEIEYDDAVNEWKHIDYSLRITAPDLLTTQFSGVLEWFRLKELPFEYDKNKWFNYIVVQ